MLAFDMANVIELNLEDIVKPFKGLRIVKCPSRPSDHWSKTSRRLLEYQLQCSMYVLLPVTFMSADNSWGTPMAITLIELCAPSGGLFSRHDRVAKNADAVIDTVIAGAVFRTEYYLFFFFFFFHIPSMYACFISFPEALN